MARIRKTKKKLRIHVFGTVIMVACFALYLVCSIVLKSVNVSLNLQRQSYYDQIAKVKVANESASMQVQQLSAYARVSTIVGSEMNANSDNVVNIGN